MKIRLTKDIFIPVGTEMTFEIEGEGDRTVPSIFLGEECDVNSAVLALLFIDASCYETVEECSDDRWL